MNYSTAVFLINKHVRGIMCSYVPKDDREYKETLFKTLDDTIKLDDYVVVPTDTRHKMTVCKVVAVDVDVALSARSYLAHVPTPIKKHRSPDGTR